MGYEVLEVYADEGISGKDTQKRKAYQRMMLDAKEGKFDVLIIWKLSRLARNTMTILKTVEALNQQNIDLLSISEQMDFSTNSGTLMLQMLSSFAEFERNQISENVQMSMKSLVKNSKRYAGGRRLGYISGLDEKGMKQLVVEPTEAKIIQLIYAKYLEGNGYRAIANELNRQGYQTVKGNSFSTTAVKDILHNKIYAGYLEYARYEKWEEKRRKGKNPKPILVKGSHEPIICFEMYEAVQEKLALESQQPKWNHQGENVLTGLLRCPKCGAPMAASNVTNTLKDGTKKRIRYYSCSVFRNNGASVCSANSIRADFAEKFVADRLKELVQVPEILTSLVHCLNEEMVEQIRPLEQELAVIASQNEEIQQKLRKWQDLLIDNPELMDTLHDRIKELKDQLAVNQTRENEILLMLRYKDTKIKLQDVQQIVKSIDVLLEKREKKEIKAIYRSFIEKITFDPMEKEHLQMTMKFNDEIINQLNEYYQTAVSDKKDTAVFMLSSPFELVV